MRDLREQLLGIIEKNSRIDLKELAVILGVEEVDVVNELAAMESEGIICGYHTLIDWDKTSLDKISALIEVRVTPQRGQGFDNIAELFERVAAVEECHMKQLVEIHRQLQTDTMYRRDMPVKWKCSECGHEEVLSSAWDVCPLCKSPQGFVMLNLPGN